MQIPVELERQLVALSGLPSPPVVATRLIELARQPDPDAKALAAVIALDSALSAKLLRVANSPLYPHFRQTETLRQAITVLGINAALTIGLSFSLVKALRSGVRGPLDFSPLWRRSFLSAFCARSLGEALRSPFLEELFLAGLLQEIGLLALANIAPGFYGPERLSGLEPEALIKAERAKFGADHAEVGAWLLESWNMPERTVKAVARSHGRSLPEVHGGSRHFNEIIVLSAALADVFLANDPTSACARMHLLCEELVDLGEVQFHAVLDRMHALLGEAEQLFDLKLVSHPEEIIAQARELLLCRQLTASGSYEVNAA